MGKYTASKIANCATKPIERPRAAALALNFGTPPLLTVAYYGQTEGATVGAILDPAPAVRTRETERAMAAGIHQYLILDITEPLPRFQKSGFTVHLSY